MLNLAILFVLLFAIWLLLSGIFTPFFLILGAGSCLAATVIYKAIYKDKIDGLLISTFRLVWYSLWLVKEIAVSSLAVSLKMWQLDPEISPQMAWLPSGLKDDFATTIYANSITLSPGTVAVGIKKGKIQVHSLTKEGIEDLKEGKMLAKVNKIRSVKGK